MTARVLVVDDILANVKLLEARLSAEYFDVLTAYSRRRGARRPADRARRCGAARRHDAGHGRLRGLPAHQEPRPRPCTCRSSWSPRSIRPPTRCRGWRPAPTISSPSRSTTSRSITRVKNLARLKTLNDEMMLRMATGAEIGALPGGSRWRGRRPKSPAASCWSRTSERVAERVRPVLGKIARGRRRARSAGGAAAPRRAGPTTSSSSASIWRSADGLRLCSQVRSLERTRHLPIIVVVQPGEEARLLRALDMGVNDYLMRPVDRNELLARVRTQIKRKRHSDYLRDRLEESVELAVTDALTGLHNRRYMETHLTALAEQAQSDRPAAFACCWSTSTTSSRSTTPTATTPATACCASSRPASAATRAASIWPAASAARSSSSSCRTRPGAGLPDRRAPARVHRRRAVPGQRRHADSR